MNPSDVRLDELGFPIPPTFDASQPIAKAVPATVGRGKIAVRALLVALAIGAAIMALLRAELGEPLSQAVAEWLASHAIAKCDVDDLDGALRDLDRAVAWHDKAPSIYALRGQVRLEQGNLEGSVADFNKVISLAPRSSSAYEWRSMAMQRMERHDDAIRDISQAIDMRRTSDPGLLNSRAYIRAIAQKDLPAALQDIQQALQLEGDNPHYLDTQGYLHFLMGNYEQAREDLDKALELAGQTPALPMLLGGDAKFQRMVARRQRIRDHALAVMYHHRGQIHQELGNSEQAEIDLRRGDELGYNPAAGVY